MTLLNSPNVLILNRTSMFFPWQTMYQVKYHVLCPYQKFFFPKPHISPMTHNIATVLGILRNQSYPTFLHQCSCSTREQTCPYLEETSISPTTTTTAVRRAQWHRCSGAGKLDWIGPLESWGGGNFGVCNCPWCPFCVCQSYAFSVGPWVTFPPISFPKCSLLFH